MIDSMANYNSQIVDLCTLSDTMPDLPENIIPRDNYMQFFEDQLKEYNVVCVDAEDGVGVTTTLAMFAHYHHYNCVSYFNNGLVKALLDPQIIEQSLTRQLQFYIDRTTILSDTDTNRLSVKDFYIKVVRKLRQSSLPLYFVFDGFDNIPVEVADNIKSLMANMPWDKARFIFSGKKSEIAYLLPTNEKVAPDCQLHKFSRYDVHSFLRKKEPSLTDEECDALFDISCGKGYVLQAMLLEYEKEKSFKPLLDFDKEKTRNFYEYNYNEIENSPLRESALKLLALIAFSEIKLTRDAICRILDTSIEDLTEAMGVCQNYLDYKNNVVVFTNDSNHKFIRVKLQHLKNETELLMVQYFKTDPSNLDYYSYMPALLKSLNDKKGIVAYLNSTTVQKILVQEQSQAALNEQCEYGFYACNLSDSVQAADAFRFALNKSTSREVEKNKLWDYQIDAYIAIGDFEKAYALASSVFLKEERLKSLLIIAKHRKDIPSEFMEAIGNDVDMLVDEIKFENIPNKALELARLMFPYKFTAAVQIIDRIAKVSKNRSEIDKLYTLISLSTGDEGLDSNQFNFDVVNAKIEDDSLRLMARAARTLFEDTNSSHIIAELNNMPSPQQRLYLLRYWIPEHVEIKGIGEIVKYAVNLVISLSNTEVPRASLVKDFCSALTNMSKEDVEQVMMMIDSVKETVLAPSEDYVNLELLVIKALFPYDDNKAGERLMNLYLYVSSLTNVSTSINCKAIILSQFEELGDKNTVEKWLMASFELQKEIEIELLELLSVTAYHIKVVESPLKSLAHIYPSTVDTIIKAINTEERRSKAYCIAANAYLRNTKEDKFNWDYFKKLLKSARYEESGKSTVIGHFADFIYYLSDVSEEIVTKVKGCYDLFTCVEQSFIKCESLAKLYVWFNKNKPDDSITAKIKNDLDKCWEGFHLPWLKVDAGFLIAKNYAKVSRDDAKEMIRRSNKILNETFMSSSSSVAAYMESLNLYTRSLGMLIRADICEESDMEQYSEVIGKLNMDGEQMIFWSRIALEFLLSGKTEDFKKYCNKYVVKHISDFPVFYQKIILFQISPAVYLYGPGLFYNEMDKYDEYFADACIDKVAKFILNKYPYPSYADVKDESFELSYQDCEMLIDLMEHCTDDAVIFSLCDSLCKGLKENKLSIGTESKNYLIRRLDKVVADNLPTKYGIQHDGYKIACMISIWNLKSGNQKLSDLDDWEQKINTISNKADRAFLYVHFAHYVNRGDRRGDYIRKASTLASEIPSTYDSTNRIDMCISECIDTTKGIAKEIIQKAYAGLISDKSGNLDDFRRLIDLVYQFDPKLASQLVDDLDRDPVRLHYKRKLRGFIESEQKAKDANNDLSVVRKMNSDEQMRFFSKQLERQVSGRMTPRNVDDTMVVLSKIFDYPITEAKDAILFFMENVYRKNLINHNHGGLLAKVHQAILFNLKIVLSLSSGTREKLRRLDLAINEQYKLHNDSFMPAGETERAVNYIKEWYRRCPYDNLMIMDAYFRPEQLFIVKELMGINSNLCVDIVTHKQNVSDMSEYQQGWNKISSDLTGKVTIHALCYENEKNSGPLHARWWLCVNNDENIKKGIKLTSVSGLGCKDEDIAEIEDEKINDIEHLFFDYIFFKKRRVNDHFVIYDTFELEQPN